MASTSKEGESRSNMGKLFGSWMSWPPYTVSRLMRLKQCKEDEKWIEKAVTTLVKKLRGKKGALEELERALSRPGTPTSCVTIPNSTDGRLQILHCKGFPHVIYCRVWRWPDLKSHRELQPLPCCQFPYSKKTKEVCVNPYHYKRLTADVFPPVLVPRYNDSVPRHALLPFQERIEPTLPPTVTCTTTGFIGYDLNTFGACSSMCQQENSTVLETSEPLPGSSKNSLSCTNEETNLDSCVPPVQPVPYEEREFWASIAYYELNSRVGEMFHCKNTTITIDGYTNPDESGGKFSIGKFNNLQRNVIVEMTRQNIGAGITLEYVMGQVYLECLSSHPVFIQSRLLNQTNHFFASTVCKIVPGGSIKIFDNAEFSRFLSECVACSYESVFELTKMCTIRIGFVKGWGAPYNRMDVTSTPTWIEIHLNGPLKWLDRVLIEMVESTNAISSVS